MRVRAVTARRRNSTIRFERQYFRFHQTRNRTLEPQIIEPIIESSRQEHDELQKRIAGLAGDVYCNEKGGGKTTPRRGVRKRRLANRVTICNMRFNEKALSKNKRQNESDKIACASAKLHPAAGTPVSTKSMKM